MRSFLYELKRRNVLRAGALYAGAAWALAQGMAQLFPVFGIADWVVRWFVAAAAIGFPLMLAFSWFYELTPGGLKRESEIDPADSITRSTGKKLDRWIIATLAVAVALLYAVVWPLTVTLAVPPSPPLALSPLVRSHAWKVKVAAPL